MVLVKTPLGQQAMKDRQGNLTSRQRSAFILFDGKRTAAEVLAATAAMGITQDDLDSMLLHGLLEPLGGPQGAAMVPSAAAPAPTSGAMAAEAGDRTGQQRYQDAYQVATELTAGLGLRGFRLNLAVEGSSNFADLVALAPKIREAVGDAKFAKLHKALFD